MLVRKAPMVMQLIWMGPGRGHTGEQEGVSRRGWGRGGQSSGVSSLPNGIPKTQFRTALKRSLSCEIIPRVGEGENFRHRESKCKDGRVCVCVCVCVTERERSYS